MVVYLTFDLVLIFLIPFGFMQGKGSTLGVGRGRAVAMRARVSCILFKFYPGLYLDNTIVQLDRYYFDNIVLFMT